MIYLADTANVDEINKLFYYFPLEEITTKPTISKEQKPNKKLKVLVFRHKFELN
jgi:fructose-6-phosphate aldolase 2